MLFAWSDASDSDALLTSSTLAAIGVGTLDLTLTVRLTLEVLLEPGVRDASRFTRTAGVF